MVGRLFRFLLGPSAYFQVRTVSFREGKWCWVHTPKVKGLEPEMGTPKSKSFISWLPVQKVFRWSMWNFRGVWLSKTPPPPKKKKSKLGIGECDYGIWLMMFHPNSFMPEKNSNTGRDQTFQKFRLPGVELRPSISNRGKTNCQRQNLPLQRLRVASFFESPSESHLETLKMIHNMALRQIISFWECGVMFVLLHVSLQKIDLFFCWV